MLRKITIFIVIIYWVIISFNTKFIGADSYLFFGIVGVCLFTFLIERCRMGKIRLISSINMFNADDYYDYKFRQNLKRFLFIVVVYIFLSFLGLGTWFEIEGLEFDKSYIMRHAYFILTIPIGYFLAQFSYGGFLQKILTFRRSLALYVILTVYAMSGLMTISGRALFVGIGSYLFIQKKDVLSFLLMIGSVYLTTGEQSAPVVAAICMIAVLLFSTNLSNFLEKNFSMVFYFMVFMMLIIIIFTFDQLYTSVFRDSNAVWRLQYWIHEIKILIKTSGAGVGFGTAYATNDLLKTIINKNAFLDGGLFVTTQHSSVINMFYRMGLIGGLFFINLHLSLVQWVGHIIKKNEKKNLCADNSLIIWAFGNFVFHFVIIIMNPGIESPKFLWGYLCFIGILIGLLCKSMSQIQKMKYMEDDNDKKNNMLFE